MGWLIFASIVIAYWAVGIHRMPVYFRRHDDATRERWPNIYDEADSHKSAAWTALWLAAFWPYYEGGLWLRERIIHTMTAEQRRQRDYEKAQRIVDEYTKRKEREEREAFDRQLRGDDPDTN